MKVTILQRNIQWANPALNVQRANEAIELNPGSDLYVLPEMFTTGFCTHPEGITESTESDSLNWMKSKAAQTGSAIAGSIAVTKDGKYYNRFYFVKPDGSVAQYDKKHLFTYGGEHLRFTPGNERVGVEWKGVRILLAICYDLRFPVWMRNSFNDTFAYDLALVVASWPARRANVWKQLLVARAIENMSYVVGVNRIGKDIDGVEFVGDSRVVDFKGTIIDEIEQNKEQLKIVTLSHNNMSAFRTKMPFYLDWDNFDIK